MRSDSFRQAEVEAMNDNIEQQVGMRTAELTKATAMVELQCSVARILAETDSWNDAAELLIGTISSSLFSGCEKAWGAYWSFNEDRTLLVCTKTQQFPNNSVAQLESASRNVSFVKGQGLPGRVWEANTATQIRNILTDDNLPRLKAATNAGLSSALAFPVIDGDSMIGVLEFFADREFVLDEPTMEIMQSLGRQIGQFIVRRQTEQERRRLASIVEHSNDAIFSKCNSDIIRSWNDGARRLSGYTQEEAIGQNLSVLVPLDKVFELKELDATVSTGERITDLETQRVSKSGERIDVSLSRAPLFDDRGCHVGSSITAQDIRERKLPRQAPAPCIR